jgi:hypothetical protein
MERIKSLLLRSIPKKKNNINGGVMGCCINGPQVERALTWVKEGVAEACWIAAYTWDKNDDVEA